jgi:hypothetical protein
MVSVFDILNHNANAQLLAQMTRQFGISLEQANAGIAALMPAYAEGMRRVMTDPSQFFRLMGMFAENRENNAFAQAFTPAGIARGNEILGELFGTKELSRAVASQAAAASGLSQTILKSMLPALAPAILQAMFQLMTGGMGGAATKASAPDPFGPLGRMFNPGAGGAADANPFGKMLQDMMAGGGWGKALEGMMGGGKRAADNPLGKMFEEMLGGAVAGGGGSPSTTGAQERGAARGERPDAGKALEDLIGGMFETGRTMQRDYQRNMESIFDQFLGGMKKG